MRWSAGSSLALALAACALSVRGARAQDAKALAGPDAPPACAPTSSPDSLRGRVQYDGTHWPVAGANAELLETGCFASSDAAGRFTLPAPRAGTYHLRLTAGFRPLSMRTLLVQVTRAGSWKPAEFSLPVAACVADRPSVRIVGAVRDDSTGSPIALATVSIDDTHCLTLTDSLGRFAIYGVPHRELTIQVVRSGYILRRLRVTPRRSNAAWGAMEIRLKRGGLELLPER